MNKQFVIFEYISRMVKLLLYMIILWYSAFSYAKNSPVTCQQIEDVMCNGTRYMQLVFADSKGNYTTGYLESYDNPSKSCLFYVFNEVPNASGDMVQLLYLMTKTICKKSID